MPTSLIASTGGWKATATRPWQWATSVRGARQRATSTELPRPAVSAGNLHFGGSAKTPFALWVVEVWQGRGLRPAVLIRGHGGDGRQRVLRGRAGGGAVWNRSVASLRDGECRTAASWSATVGDEAALLAARLPGVPIGVGPDRLAAAQDVLEAAPEVDRFVLDDAFQTAAVGRSVDVVLLPCVLGIDGLRARPGPLREGPSALGRAAALVLVVEGPERVERRQAWHLLNLLDWRGPWALAMRRPREARLYPDGAVVPLAGLLGQRALTLAGVGDPTSFRRMCDSLLRVDWVQGVERPDHHRFQGADGAELDKWFRRWDADVVLTTEKDAMRLEGLGAASQPLVVVGIDLGFHLGEQGIRHLLP